MDPRKGSYYVHYQGWKKRWDEWVSPDRIMPINEENRALAAKVRVPQLSFALSAAPAGAGCRR